MNAISKVAIGTGAVLAGTTAAAAGFGAQRVIREGLGEGPERPGTFAGTVLGLGAFAALGGVAALWPMPSGSAARVAATYIGLAATSGLGAGLFAGGMQGIVEFDG